MVGIETIVAQVLLQFLLILTPIYFYRFIFSKPTKMAQLYGGLIFGVASIISMSFPIVLENGEMPFLSDLRFIPFLFCILYMGRNAGMVSGILLISFPFILEGLEEALLHLAVTLLLFIVFLGAREKYRDLSKAKKHLFQMASSLLISFILVVATWFLHDWKEVDIFFHQHKVFISIIGAGYFLSMMIYTKLTEDMVYSLRLVEQIHKAEKLNIVSELAASIAHEIRNPLTVVRGFLQISKDRVDHSLQGYMNTAISELDRAEAIISDYLNFAKPQLVQKSEEFNVSETIKEIILLMESYSNIKGIALTREVEDGLYITGDHLKFKQAIINIIKNAIEATENGSVDIRTAYCLKRDQVVVDVMDTGLGMTEAQLQNLGKPYYSTKNSGTGLGLLVTYRLLEEMNGALTFDSKLDQGTKVSIHIDGRKKVDITTNKIVGKSLPFS